MQLARPAVQRCATATPINGAESNQGDKIQDLRTQHCFPESPGGLQLSYGGDVVSACADVVPPAVTAQFPYHSV